MLAYREGEAIECRYSYGATVTGGLTFPAVNDSEPARLMAFGVREAAPARGEFGIACIVCWS